MLLWPRTARSAVRAYSVLPAIALVAGLIVSPPASHAAQVRATKASAFIDSVGVNAHFEQGVYRGRFERTQKLVGELGIRHIRQRLGHDRTKAVQYRELNRLYGVRLLNLMNNRDFETGETDLDGMKVDFEFAKSELGLSRLSGFEGLNEYSKTKYVNNNLNWHLDAREAANFLHNLVDNDSSLNSLPVLAPSIFKRVLEDYERLGDLSSVIDYGVLHYYTSTGSASKLMDKFITDAQIVSGGKALWVTETGWPTAMPARTAAKYLPRRLVLLARDPRVSKSFIFTLLDRDTSGPGYGLVTSHFTKKKTFYAVRNLVRLLKEPSGAYQAGFLNYRLTASTTDVQQYLLQKKDGTFYLILWREVNSYNQKDEKELNPPPANVFIFFEQAVSRVQTFLPSAIDKLPDSGLQAVQTWSAPAAVTVAVPDHLLLVKIEMP